MIRKRLPEHDKAILNLVQTLLLPYARITQPYLTVDLKMLRKRLHGCKAFVYVNTGRAVGGFVAIKHTRNAVFVDMLAVHPAYQSQGLGSQLMKHAERTAELAGRSEIYLWVDDTNVQAQRFYVSKRYKPVHFDGKIRCYLLRKQL